MFDIKVICLKITSLMGTVRLRRMPITCGTVCEAIVAGSLEFLVLACHSEPCGTWVLTTRKEQCFLLLFGLPYGLDSNSVVE